MNTKKQAAYLRVVRKIHRTTGIVLLIFFLALSLTGLALGWKKNVAMFQAPTETGVTKDVAQWLPMDSLIAVANARLVTLQGDHVSTKIDKVDARPGKGIVKVIYDEHYHSFQLDAMTGEILSSEFRTSDFIEHLHDGTIVDNFLNLPAGIFKLFYTTVMGLALLTFVATGFWLWYGPKVIRHSKR